MPEKYADVEAIPPWDFTTHAQGRSVVVAFIIIVISIAIHYPRKDYDYDNVEQAFMPARESQTGLSAPP